MVRPAPPARWRPPRLRVGAPLTEVDPLVAARTHVGFPGERGDTGGWEGEGEGEGSGRGTAAPTPAPSPRGHSAQPTFAGPLRGAAGLALLSSGHGDLDGASDLRFLGRGLLVDVGAGTSDIHPCGVVGTVGGWPVGSPTTQPSQPPPNFSEKGPPRPTVGSGPPPRGHPWAADFRERHGGCWSFKDGRGRHGEGEKGAGGIQGSTASRQASPRSLLGRGSAMAMLPSAGADHRPWRPTQAHLWVRTAWHSRACGRRAFRHARQRAGHEGGGLAWAPRPPSLPGGRAHLGVAPWRQRLAAVLAPEAESVPVFAQGAHLLSWGGRGIRASALLPSRAQPPAAPAVLPAPGQPLRRVPFIPTRQPRGTRLLPHRNHLLLPRGPALPLGLRHPHHPGSRAAAGNLDGVPAQAPANPLTRTPAPPSHTSPNPPIRP